MTVQEITLRLVELAISAGGIADKAGRRRALTDLALDARDAARVIMGEDVVRERPKLGRPRKHCEHGVILTEDCPDCKRVVTTMGNVTVIDGGILKDNAAEAHGLTEVAPGESAPKA